MNGNRESRKLKNFTIVVITSNEANSSHFLAVKNFYISMIQLRIICNNAINASHRFFPIVETRYILSRYEKKKNE